MTLILGSLSSSMAEAAHGPQNANAQRLAVHDPLARSWDASLTRNTVGTPFREPRLRACQKAVRGPGRN